MCNYYAVFQISSRLVLNITKNAFHVSRRFRFATVSRPWHALPLKQVLATIAIAAVMIFGAVNGWAQSAASVSGTITDSTGARLSKAKVVIRNYATHMVLARSVEMCIYKNGFER